MTNKELFAQMIIDFCTNTSCNKCTARNTCDKIDGGFNFDVEDIIKIMDGVDLDE